MFLSSDGDTTTTQSPNCANILVTHIFENIKMINFFSDKWFASGYIVYDIQ